MMAKCTHEAVQSPNQIIELNHVKQLNRVSCIALWRKTHNRHPPAHLSIQFMRKSLLFEAQVKSFGGHSKAVRKIFKQALKASGSIKAKNCLPSPLVKPGMHLVREWNGKTYRVEVVEQGFVMNGRNYQSLSAIAKHITRAHWSGPRFFGLGCKS